MNNEMIKFSLFGGRIDKLLCKFVCIEVVNAQSRFYCYRDLSCSFHRQAAFADKIGFFH